MLENAQPEGRIRYANELYNYKDIQDIEVCRRGGGGIVRTSWDVRGHDRYSIISPAPIPNSGKGDQHTQ